MKLNKTYCISQSNRAGFIHVSYVHNSRIVQMIDDHGGSFKVLNISCYDGDEFVDKVMFADGTTANSTSDEYFEIAHDEFKYFDEVGAEGGVVSMTIEVNSGNFEAMVELIKNTFKK